MYGAPVLLFDKWLHNALMEKGWSGADLARISGVNKVSIYHYLAGDREPQFHSLQLILRALGKKITITDI